jgi:hypothetical protein
MYLSATGNASENAVRLIEDNVRCNRNEYVHCNDCNWLYIIREAVAAHFEQLAEREEIWCFDFSAPVKQNSWMVR